MVSPAMLLTNHLESLQMEQSSSEHSSISLQDAAEYFCMNDRIQSLVENLCVRESSEYELVRIHVAEYETRAAVNANISSAVRGLCCRGY